MHTLDWKHAWTGRLLTTAPTRPQALKLLEPQLDSCNARLIGEVASGKLPFLNLPFRSSLTARLKALTPQLRRFKHMVVLGIGGSALVHNGVPLTRLEVAESSMRAAGEVMGLLMATTVLTGWLMNINPLDQPAVELGKRLAYSRLGSSSYPEEAAILKAFLD